MVGKKELAGCWRVAPTQAAIVANIGASATARDTSAMFPSTTTRRNSRNAVLTVRASKRVDVCVVGSMRQRVQQHVDTHRVAWHGELQEIRVAVPFAFERVTEVGVVG